MSTAAIAAGYLLFLVVVAALILAAMTGRKHHRDGALPFDPLRWMIIWTSVLLILAALGVRAR